jgi:hypothetical protein
MTGLALETDGSGRRRTVRARLTRITSCSQNDQQRKSVREGEGQQSVGKNGQTIDMQNRPENIHPLHDKSTKHLVISLHQNTPHDTRTYAGSLCMRWLHRPKNVPARSACRSWRAPSESTSHRGTADTNTPNRWQSTRRLTTQSTRDEKSLHGFTLATQRRYVRAQDTQYDAPSPENVPAISHTIRTVSELPAKASGDVGAVECVRAHAVQLV